MPKDLLHHCPTCMCKSKWDMPTGCKCEPLDWFEQPGKVCRDFKGWPRLCCNECEHLPECHDGQETKSSEGVPQ